MVKMETSHRVVKMSNFAIL